MTTSASPRRFQFLREIAAGGFGSVYLAKVIHADGFSRLVALKLLHKRWSENDEVASRMRDEARLLGWLRHRHIVEVLDLTFIDGRSAVVMEYLEAIDAKGLVERSGATQTDIPVPVVCEFGAATASALDAAYNRAPYAGEKPLRVIHRDIKPSNLMVDANGTVKVLDFGVARAEFDTREAKTAELSFGSLEYMPPERLFFEPESPASDVYSLGSTLYELLALEKLGKARLRQSEQDRFVQERLQALFARRTLEPHVRKDLEPLLTRMLAFDESDRPTSAELVAKLRAIARSSAEAQAEDWAARHVLALIDAVRAGERASGEGGTLIGQTIAEDAPAQPEGVRRPLTVELPTPALDPLRALDTDGPDSAEYTTSTGHDEARWSALKEATLASLNETGELNKAMLSPSLGGRGADATLPNRGTPKPAQARTPAALGPGPRRSPSGPGASRPGGAGAGASGAGGSAAPAPTSIPPVPPALVAAGTIDALADEETLAETAPASAEGRRAARPPAPSTQRLPPGRTAESADRAASRSSSPPGRSSSPPKASPPPGASRVGSRPPAPGSRPAPPPVEEEPGTLSVEVLVAMSLVAAAGVGTFLAVLAIGVPIVAMLLGVIPTGAPPRPVQPVLVTTAPDPAPEPAPPPPPQKEGEASVPAVTPPSESPPPAAGLVFVSQMAGTRKMTARCDTGTSQGEARVELGTVAPQECTVIAIGPRRRQAAVKAPKAGVWSCFAGDADTCEPSAP
jgi:serine/threonine protein kinase